MHSYLRPYIARTLATRTLHLSSNLYLPTRLHTPWLTHIIGYILLVRVYISAWEPNIVYRFRPPQVPMGEI